VLLLVMMALIRLCFACVSACALLVLLLVPLPVFLLVTMLWQQVPQASGNLLLCWLLRVVTAVLATVSSSDAAKAMAAAVTETAIISCRP